MELIGVILSGGNSTRMGTDKGLKLFQGIPLVKYPLKLLQQFTSDIVISTSNPEYNQFGFKLLPDIIKNIGPIGGLYTALSTLNCDKIFLSACDMPFASIALARTLLKISAENDVVVPGYNNGNIEPLFGIYSRSILHIVESHIQSENFKMYNLITSCNAYIHLIDESIKNINSPEDE